MKKEDLFDGFGAIDDTLLERSEKSNVQKHFDAKKWIKIGSKVACLALVFILSRYLLNDSGQTHLDTDKADTLTEEKYVDVSNLIASNSGLVNLEGLQLTMIDMGEYTACYEKVQFVRNGVLKASIGSEVEGAQNWYRVSGHEDMQYLILEKEDEYSLWKFYAFQSENYSYNDVLKNIYNIQSAEDIEKIVVTPANMDNSDEGKALQNQIGTKTITDRESIKAIYDVLTGLTCYGDNNWEMIGLLDGSLLNQVRVGRYLTIITSQGMEVDRIKYTGVSHTFYEYGGIAYDWLVEEEYMVVEKILGIE